MSLIDNNFKSNLIGISTEIKKRIIQKESIMAKCIELKLQNTLDMYENELLNTCNYVLIRNPVTITKNIFKLEEDK